MSDRIYIDGAFNMSYGEKLYGSGRKNSTKAERKKAHERIHGIVEKRRKSPNHQERWINQN